MTATIKAIETEYAGCRFRSRLEARWAVFFDHLGIRWQYEPEGLDIEGVRYLPDFRLDGLARGPIFLEVKGRMDERSANKILLLALHAPVLLAMDIPRPGTLGPHFCYFIREASRAGGHHVVAWNVTLLPKTIEPVTWTVMPFGWPSLPLMPGSETSAEWFMQIVADMPNQSGWVQTNYLIDGALAEARSARFEAY